ncbi:MAG: DUF1553 domain-containing protein, partial [Gemmataceae bacterium]
MATNKWNEDDQINYSRAVVRRLPAEVLYDAIHRATGSRSRLPGLPSGARAALLLDSTQDAPGGFLDTFGKPPRESACECERGTGVQLGPVLNLVNGPVVGEAVRDPGNRLAELLRKEKDSAKIVEELYLSFLARYPTPREMQAALSALKDGQEDYDAMMAESQRRQQALAAHEKTIPGRMAAWEAGLARKPEWQPLEIVKMTASSGATLTRQPDGSILLSGKNEANDLYTIIVKTPLKQVTALRLEALPDKSLPAMGPGRAPNGNLVLNEVKVTAEEIGKTEKPRPVGLTNAQASFSQDGFPVTNAIDNNPGSGWALAPQAGKANEALFQLQQPLVSSQGVQLTVTLDHRFGGQHTLGKFRLMASSTPPPLALGGAPPALADALKVEPAKRTPQQKATLETAYRAQDADLNRLRGEVSTFPVPVD